MLILLLATCAAWPADCPREKSVPNELPRSWSLEEVAKATPPYGVKGRVYVLAWRIQEDERPLRVESCLVLRVLEKNKGYCLAHLHRHPADKNPKWDLSISHVSGEKGTKYWPGLWIMHAKSFKNRPGNKEVYAALSWENVDWRFDLNKGWKIVSCGVCEKSWLEATGEKPTKFFGP
jgi:hypothetical protein